MCLFCLQMDPAGIIIDDETSNGAGCNGCLPKGSEVRVTMDGTDPENPARMTALAAQGHVSLSSESLQIHLANQRRAVCVDEWCRFIFPIGFILFNLAYWNYYQNIDPE